MRREREKFVKSRKIKKGKNPSVIFRGGDNLFYEKQGLVTRSLQEELPFEIPENWAWARLSSIVNFVIGKTPPRKDADYWRDGNYNWVSIADMVSDGVTWSTKEFINDYAAKKIFSGKISRIGTLLMSFKLTIGKVSILGIDAFHNEAIISITPYWNPENVLRDFLFKFLPIIVQNGDTKAAIKGTTLNSESISNLLIPIPPLAEQRRIVAQLETILPHVEAYGEKETELTQLNATFPEALKKSILQEAIQGRLVPQDPNEEPASVLLERIRKEKARLVKQGKIKKDKKESIIVRRDNSHYEKIGLVETCIDEELPFEIPENWAWARLGSVGDWSSGSTPSRSNKEYYNGTIPWLKTGDLNDGYIDKTSEKITDLAFQECSLRLNPIGSVLIAMYGATIGKLGILEIEATTNQACCSCYPLLLYNKYLFFFLLAWKTRFIKKAEGGAQPNISKEKIIATLIPLPPLAEQRRIVAQLETALASLKSLE